MRLNTKSIEVEEVGEKGEVVARIATFGVKDHDGDVTVAGAFGEQKVALLNGHDWGRVAGKGVITEDADGGLFKGQFNLNTHEGRESFETVKFQADLQEWSYGYLLEKDGYEVSHKDGERVRTLKRIDVYEVSPVVVGAGIGTGTVDVKGRDATMNLIKELADDGDTAAASFLEQIEGEAAEHKGLKFVEEVDRVVTSVTNLQKRAAEIVTLRAEDGRTMSAASMEKLLTLLDALAQAESDLRDLADSDEGDVIDMSGEFLRYQRQLAIDNGVTV